MKVVHIINSDIRGGAPRAALGLSTALNSLGITSNMLVQRKFGSSTTVESVSEGFIAKQMTNFRMLADLLQMRLFTKTDKGRFSFGTVGTDISGHRLIRQADILHLHWINEGYLSLADIAALKKLNRPVVWTLHDMWAFTGGCHYSAGCLKYKNECNNCPYLKRPSEHDFSSSQQNKKIPLYASLDPVVVTCSRWLGREAKSSQAMKALRIETIPNTINTDVYRPLDKSECRRRYKLPEDKLLILFAALNTNEERKGFRQLKETLSLLADKYPLMRENTELMVLGTSTGEELKGLPVKANAPGRIYGDDAIAAFYNAADVFVAPSLEDNLPNTVMEALSCGIPAAAFNIGGMPDMIEHRKNGYLAEPFSTESLADGIYSILNDSIKREEMKKAARAKVVANFSPEAAASQYLRLYRQLL